MEKAGLIHALSADITPYIQTAGGSSCIYADVGNAPKAIILEPMYTIFTSFCQSYPGCTDYPGSEGDTAFNYLVKSGYATWYYKDTAASDKHFQELDDYDVAMVCSHMNDHEIQLSVPSQDDPTVGELIFKRNF
ncbi:MAG: hypothetical protein ACE14P_15615 [Methanotrichaceae archaeon]